MTSPTPDSDLRNHLVDLLEGGNAHITFADTVTGFPVAHAGIWPKGSPHSAWELLEHLRIAQADILLFSQGENYVEMKWPDDYWPPTPAPQDPNQWEASIESVRKDFAAFIALVNDKHSNLFNPFPWAKRKTLLREALVLADHNSYHLGQLMLLRRMLE